MPTRRTIALLAAFAFGVAALAGCSSPSTPPTAEPAATAPTQTAPAADSGLHTGTYAATGSERVVFKTSKGSFTVELFKDKAPNTVSSFLELVAAKFYDGIRVHRVEPGFVMQAGDPKTKGMTAKQVADVVARQKTGAASPDDPQLGAGGPGWVMKAEFNDVKHDRGVIAMARTQDPDSAGSQFYVTLAPAHELDGQYTVFGRVVSGMPVVDKLAVGDVIQSATIVSGK